MGEPANRPETGMRVTVLGASGSFPGPGRACSGFLVDNGAARMVVDLGWARCRRCSLTSTTPPETASPRWP